MTALDYIGDLALDRRDFADPRLYHTEKLAAAKAAGSREFITHAFLDLARVAWELGDRDTARRSYQEALAVAGEFAFRRPCRRSVLTSSPASRCSRATRTLPKSMPPAACISPSGAARWTGVAGALRPLAAVIAARGEAARAARLVGAADRTCRRRAAASSRRYSGRRWWLPEQALRAALGGDRFSAQRVAGRALTLQEAIEHVTAAAPLAALCRAAGGPGKECDRNGAWDPAGSARD